MPLLQVGKNEDYRLCQPTATSGEYAEGMQLKIVKTGIIPRKGTATFLPNTKQIAGIKPLDHEIIR